MAAPTKIPDIKANFKASELVNKNEVALRATAQEGLMHKVSSETLDKMSGSGGFKYIDTTAQTSTTYKGIVINTDAVFTAISIDGTDSLTALGLNGGVTVSAGIYLPAPLGSLITAIDLTSGSAIGYY